MHPRDQKWMDNLVLVRHGESKRNVGKQAALAAGRLEFGGGIHDVDVPLTPCGEKQAEQTGIYLDGRFRFHRVCTSPYLRTLQTANLMIRHLSHPVQLTYEERIRKKEFGILDGLTRAGISRKYPEELRRREREGKYYYRPPGGESYPDVALRIHSFIGTLLRECARQSVLVVCHSVVVLILHRLLERMTEKEFLDIDRDPEQDVCSCSVTWYQLEPHAADRGRLLLREFNCIHYPARFASTEACRRKARR